MTRVINIKDAPKGWQNNSDYVYIGRPSIFGNPINIGDNVPNYGRADRDFVIAWYRKYVEVKMVMDKDFRNAVLGLRNRILVCYCHPLPCHGDILAELAEGE